MPDLITHIAFSHLAIRTTELFRKNMKSDPFRLLFYLGTMLPDLLTRPWYILFPKTYAWTVAIHTPIGAAITCGIIAQFFHDSLRRRAFIFLLSGTVSHFLLDSLQKQVIYNNYWFFPFSWKTVGWGLVWAGTLIEWIPVWLLVIALFESVVWIVQRKNSKTSD
jgi:hypothetical protein